jgi:hypothetical protein
MTEPVTLHHGYYLIDTRAWLKQRTGAHPGEHSQQLQDFTRCEVFDEYWPTIDTAARMRLWCAARGYLFDDRQPIEHDDRCLTKPVTIVLATTTGSPSHALALVSVDDSAPEVYADLTTDEGYWLAASTIQITCPSGHTWTWDGDRDLHAADGSSHRIGDLFAPNADVISRCRQCAAFDDGHTDTGCPCPGYAVYCPTCDQRCAVTVAEIPTYEEANL